MELKLDIGEKHARLEVRQDYEKTPRVVLNSKGTVSLAAVQGVLMQELQNFADNVQETINTAGKAKRSKAKKQPKTK